MKLKKNIKNTLMNLYDKILLWKMALVETVNDELKNVCSTFAYNMGLRNRQ